MWTHIAAALLLYIFFAHAGHTLNVTLQKSLRWTFKTNVEITSELVLARDQIMNRTNVIFMTVSGFLIALDSAKGAFLWSADTSSNIAGFPSASRPAIIYFDSPLNASELSQLSRDILPVKRSNRVAKQSATLKTTTIRSGVVIGGLHLIDASSGENLWTTHINTTKASYPVVSRINGSQVILIGSSASHLYCLNALGSIIWKSLLGNCYLRISASLYLIDFA